VATTFSETLLLLGLLILAIGSLGFVAWIAAKLCVYVLLNFTSLYIPEASESDESAERDESTESNA